MTKVIIAGDSYGLGEWRAGGKWGTGIKVTHPGINQYFEEYGYQVVNCAGSGFSFEESISSLRDCLFDCYQPGDIVLCIQTDPSRSVDYSTLTQNIKKHNGLNSLLYELINKNYSSLDELGKQHNTIIHLIGGLFDLYFKQTYSNLNFLIKSWIALILQDQSLEYSEYFKNQFGIIKSISIQHIMVEELDYTLSQQIIEELWQWSQNEKIIRLNRRMFNDGFHPNRHGHKILFENLVATLNLAKLRA